MYFSDALRIIEHKNEFNRKKPLFAVIIITPKKKY
jgi:hypothetical protein